ncbi:hypothetical protein DPMN_008859 [Dreissena polymorpha]|uniref:Uncharacterized protein n=1 Tax=Dreissena polymorpha TaxID=45954 RepID=A0A9D4MYY2_DREPO|nr:hypothetical protein DPMN_008859 [Dreissena polymorpha]
MLRLEQLCVQYLEAFIGNNNVLVALQNAALLQLDFLKVRCRASPWPRGTCLIDVH